MIPETQRLLPASAEAEQGVLASLFLAPQEVWSYCTEHGISREWFHVPAHGKLFAAVCGLLDAGINALDFISITQKLRDSNELDSIGGAGFISSLYTFLPTAANASYYLDILRDKYRLREMIRTCTETASRCYTAQGDTDAILESFEQSAFAVRGDATDGAEKTTKQLVREAIANVESVYQNRGRITGITTGFTEFDRLTNGFHAAEMTVMAARPGVGKTAIALNIAEHIILHEKIPVIVFSLEMSASQLMARLIYSGAKVNPQQVRDGYMTEHDFPKLASAGKKISDSFLRICDNQEGTIQAIRAKARRVASDFRKTGHERLIVIVDYLQLVSSSSKKSGNREQEVAEVSRGLKMMSRDINAPVLVLAQINRASVKEKRRPRLSDLRESGSIEQDADNVAFIHRPEMEMEHDDPARAAAAGYAELTIEKQRNGPANEMIPLTYIKGFTRFENRAAGDIPNLPEPEKEKPKNHRSRTND